MKKTALLFTIFTNLILCSCTSLQKTKSLTYNYSDEIEIKISQQEELFPPIRQRQKLKVTWGNRSMDSDSILIYENKNLDLVALGPFGTSLFHLKLRDSILESQSNALLPKEFKPSFILIDLIFIYSQREDLIRWINNPKLRIVEKNSVREFILNNKTIIKITYSSSKNKLQSIFFENLDRAYSLQIDNEKQEI